MIVVGLEVCDYCNSDNNVRNIQLWTGWFKILCPDCISKLKQKFRYMKDEQGNFIVYTDKENDLWGVE